jgi:hypothetical protein
MEINARVVGQELTITDGEGLAARTAELLTVRFEFSEEWQGFPFRFAVFYQNRVTPFTVMMEGDSVTVPWEALVATADLNIGVFATDGERRITSTFAQLTLKDGAYLIRRTPMPPTPDVWEKILAELAKKIDDAPKDGEPYARRDGGWTAVPDAAGKVDKETRFTYDDEGTEKTGKVNVRTDEQSLNVVTTSDESRIWGKSYNQLIVSWGELLLRYRDHNDYMMTEEVALGLGVSAEGKRIFAYAKGGGGGADTRDPKNELAVINDVNSVKNDLASNYLNKTDTTTEIQTAIAAAALNTFRREYNGEIGIGVDVIASGDPPTVAGTEGDYYFTLAYHGDDDGLPVGWILIAWKYVNGAWSFSSKLLPVEAVDLHWVAIKNGDDIEGHYIIKSGDDAASLPKWELLGAGAVDLSDYYNRTQVDELVTGLSGEISAVATAFDTKLLGYTTVDYVNGLVGEIDLALDAINGEEV